MGNKQFKEKVLALVNEMEARLDKKGIKKLKTKRLKKVISKLSSSSRTCSECKLHLQNLNDCLVKSREMLVEMNKTEVSAYKQLLKKAASHLRSKHKLVYKNTYTIVFAIVGIVLAALAVILLKKDDVSFYRVPSAIISVILGLCVGQILDNNAKKKGIMI